jgi:hypothetical protein
MEKTMDQETTNEGMFKNIAMTFSLEGTTEDIQSIIQKKMNYSIKILKELNGIIGSLSSSKDSSFKKSILNDSKVSNFIIDAYDDYKVIIGCTNTLLYELMKKKNYITKEIITK